MIGEKILYSLDDLMIEPSPITRIRHRGDISTTYKDGFLPIFTAPMPCVVSLKDNQYKKYLQAGINPIIPRTEALIDRVNLLNSKENIFIGFSLDEFTTIFNDVKFILYDKPMKILVDIACGSMEELHTSIRYAKNKFGEKLTIMSGNVASPEQFRTLAESGCDYIRCSVGSGSGCCTATYTGVYYPMGSLIDECNRIKNSYPFRNNYPELKIIADGGITTYRNAFKALALGADYVMMGSRLCQCEDSAGEIINKGETLTRRENKRKLYFGMASEIGSQLLGKDATAPEGMAKEYPILAPIAEYARLFSRYLSSTMSYCNSENLYNFIGQQKLNVISPSAQRQFNQ